MIQIDDIHKQLFCYTAFTLLLPAVHLKKWETSINWVEVGDLSAA